MTVRCLFTDTGAVAAAGSPLSRRFYLFLIVMQVIVLVGATALLVAAAVDRDWSELFYPVLLLVIFVSGLLGTVRRQRRAVSRRQRIFDQLERSRPK